MNVLKDDLEHIKEFLEIIINDSGELPLSPCDTPIDGDIVNTVCTFRRTIDFIKGQKHMALIVLNLINELAEEDN